MAIIYKVTYKINPNRIYIGKTVRSLEERRRQHERNPNVWSLSDESFDKILLKKGLDNWKWEIIERNIETEEELDRAEINNIKLYKENGYNLFNIIHNPKIKSDLKNKANYGGVKSWDPANTIAHNARYFTGKIKPVINLKSETRYKTIIELRDKEKISTPMINKLCKTGEPHPKNGNQYAFLDLDNNPILYEGHKKSYTLLQEIEIVEIKTGKNYRLNLFDAMTIINCKLGELTKMKILNLGGKRDDITCNGFIIFALDKDGNRIVSDRHEKVLERAKINRSDIFIWSWNIENLKWEYINKVKGYKNASKFLAEHTNHQKPSELSNKIIEILNRKRTHIKGYTFTSNSNTPHNKPRLKLRPVLLLNSNDGETKYFKNAKMAAKQLNLESEYIIECCNGNRNRNITAGYRFAWSNEQGEPIYTKQHEKYLRKKTGLGKSVYWLEGEQTFRSIAELKRHLDILNLQNDERVPYVPKAEKLSKIAKGELSGLLGKGENTFKITLKILK